MFFQIVIFLCANLTTLNSNLQKQSFMARRSRLYYNIFQCLNSVISTLPNKHWRGGGGRPSPGLKRRRTLLGIHVGWDEFVESEGGCRKVASRMISGQRRGQVRRIREFKFVHVPMSAGHPRETQLLTSQAGPKPPPPSTHYSSALREERCPVKSSRPNHQPWNTHGPGSEKRRTQLSGRY